MRNVRAFAIHKYNSTIDKELHMEVEFACIQNIRENAKFMLYFGFYTKLARFLIYILKTPPE